jgi:hypothetical protein
MDHLGMDTVVGIVSFLLLLAGVVVVLELLAEVVVRSVRRMRSRRAPRPTEPPGAAQVDPELQKAREAAVKLAQEHLWLDPDILEQDSASNVPSLTSADPRSMRTSS